jgi:hypothetical protein
MEHMHSIMKACTLDAVRELQKNPEGKPFDLARYTQDL